MEQIELTGIEWVNQAIQKGVSACKEKYKANRNPMVAALYDPDPLVRAGAAYMIGAIYADRGVSTPNTIPVLKEAIKKEKDIKVRAMMRVTYARLTDK